MAGREPASKHSRIHLKQKTAALICLAGGSVSAVAMCVSITWLVAGLTNGQLGILQLLTVLVTIPLTASLLCRWDELATSEDWRDSRISSLETTCIALADANAQLQNKLDNSTKEGKTDDK
ncbi:hypothetical protein PT279_09160 [Bifidobacterium sp. ESL0784]|uniref:hypothetical protein n=1 Tax=Bifidobacterium sp. ESL0784 TaxID=2983231 RepID=UPI0023F64C35|nr:hypothetical protein [Bifidobacterium sp. ESL0784]MDF7641751.1 hypothetical protein [Bifidobacterium sp. ESL0784]